MPNLFLCKMNVTIIDGKNDKRKILAEHQADSYKAAEEILIGLSRQIAQLGFEIVPVTIDDGGLKKVALALAPMSLEQYVAFAKSIHSHPSPHADDTAASPQKEGSSLSE